MTVDITLLEWQQKGTETHTTGYFSGSAYNSISLSSTLIALGDFLDFRESNEQVSDDLKNALLPLKFSGVNFTREKSLGTVGLTEGSKYNYLPYPFLG